MSNNKIKRICFLKKQCEHKYNKVYCKFKEGCTCQGFIFKKKI